MKKTTVKIKIIFALAGIISAFGCSIADDMLGVNEAILSDRVAPAISVIEGISYAFVDADNTLQLQVSNPESGYTYYWETTGGTIDGEGVTVTYTAPSVAGNTVVRCYGSKDEYVETRTAEKTIHNIEILADNMLWLKADAITGLNSFDAVASWTDSGTVGNVLAQATEANKPRYVADSLNGRPVVRFVDNTDSLFNTALTTGSGFGVAQSQITFFIVFRVNSYIAASYILGARNGGTNSFPVLYHLAPGQQLRFYQYSAYNASPFPVLFGQTNMLSSVCDMTQAVVADKLKIWLNGTEQVDNINVAATNPTINRLYLGSLTANNSFVGDIAEVLYFSTALSDERRTQIEAYLTEKWGL
ncbi:MAG: hypothetical protein H7A26_03735 [Spirochaetales bacterium]|nr:hypothetical protein [Spirochaetales bacterium]